MSIATSFKEFEKRTKDSTATPESQAEAFGKLAGAVAGGKKLEGRALDDLCFLFKANGAKSLGELATRVESHSRKAADAIRTYASTNTI